MLNERNTYTGEFILHEVSNTMSRDEIVVSNAFPAAFVAGTVMGKVTASGEWGAYDNAAVDGREVARGILYSDVPAGAVDRKAVLIARLAEVKAGKLTGLDTPARTDLAAAFVIVR